MSGCTLCQSISSKTEPHVFWGAVAGIALSLVLVFGWAGSQAWAVAVILALLFVGIATDVLAHGYAH
jgi:FtsH-binding integral membrane protein